MFDAHEQPHPIGGKANQRHWKHAIGAAVVSTSFRRAVPDKLLRDQVLALACLVADFFSR